jgi:undecaprenyl pyrophosphate phosphatase UppP
VVLFALPAFGLVVVLAETFAFTAAVPVACIPTLVAALLLERWTRRVVPAPVPVATARSVRS